MRESTRTRRESGQRVHERREVGGLDLDRGAPELWPDPCAENPQGDGCGPGYVPSSRHRYNADVAFLSGNYSVSADVLVVMDIYAAGDIIGPPWLAHVAADLTIFTILAFELAVGGLERAVGEGPGQHDRHPVADLR